MWHPPASSPVSSSVGHPVPTHQAAWVQVSLHPPRAGLIRLPKLGMSGGIHRALVPLCVPQENFAATPKYVCVSMHECASVHVTVMGAEW